MSVPGLENVEAPRALAGEVRFVTREEAVRLRGALEAARLLFVAVGELGPGSRGRLAEVIDEAIEGALRDRGGAPPGIGASSEASAALSDQLYRARLIGRVGLAIDIAALGGLVDARGALEPEDGACLRFLAEATVDRPVALLFDVANATVRTYGVPLPLCEVLGLEAPAPPRTPVHAPPTRSAISPPCESTSASTRTQTPTPNLTLSRAGTPTPQGTLATTADEPSPMPEITPEALAEATALLGEVNRATPLTGLERAFVHGYAPMRAALLEDRLGTAGIGKHAARALCASFATTFSRAYGEAVRTFGVTGRHPRMVFELFDLAQKCARVHGARSTHVIVVDALRYDLGKRLRHRLGRVLARRAVCVEEHVLWALLPTTTPVQLDALSRGDDALKSPSVLERETSIVRGRSLDVMRRTRVGHRDVLKLDLIEGRLRESGAGERDRLESLAAELTPILARAIETSSMRTLVVVAGDHGFRFGDDGEPRDEKSATTAGQQGGASPDEVFVSFTAWLVGGVH